MGERHCCQKEILYEGLILKKNIILSLLTGITAIGAIKLLRNSFLYFTDAEAFAFFNYLSQKNEYLGVSNAAIQLFIISALVVTFLNKTNRFKKGDNK